MPFSSGLGRVHRSRDVFAKTGSLTPGAGSAASGRRSPLEAKITLLPEPRSVPVVRQFVRGVLQAVQAKECLERVEVVVSELVANALRHAGTQIEVDVLDKGEEIWVRVSDQGAGTPRRLQPGPTDLSGRGLMLVEKIAQRWGVQEEKQGKTVWAKVRC